MKPLPRDGDSRCIPVRRLLQRIGSRWPVLVVSHLEDGPKRFSDLKRAIGSVTQKSLTAALRELEKDGLVERIVVPTLPPRVDYSLTPLGRTLCGPLNALTAWAVENDGEVAKARARYEARGEGGADR